MVTARWPVILPAWLYDLPLLITFSSIQTSHLWRWWQKFAKTWQSTRKALSSTFQISLLSDSSGWWLSSCPSVLFLWAGEDDTTDWMGVKSHQFKMQLLGYSICLRWGTEVLAKQSRDEGSVIFSMISLLSLAESSTHFLRFFLWSSSALTVGEEEQNLGLRCVLFFPGVCWSRWNSAWSTVRVQTEVQTSSHKDQGPLPRVCCFP